MENKNSLNPIEKVSITKKVFNSFGIFCAIGFVVFMVGLLIGNLPDRNSGLAAIFLVGGYLLIAAPMMMSFIFKVGAFVDVGPIFTYSDVPIGNFVYRTVGRDHSAEAALGIGFTIIKLFLIFFVSLILTPLVTLAVYLCYKKNRKAALVYAKENGIEESTVPSVNKKFVYVTLLLVVALFIGAIIGSSASTAQNEKEEVKQSTEYSALFDEVIANLPTEYYADGYKGVNPSGGIIAEFMLGDVKVCYGKIANDFSLDIEGLYSGSEYYIINDEVYLDSQATGAFEINDTEAVKEYLSGRHLSYWAGADAKYTDYVSYKSEGKVALMFESNSKKYSIVLDSDKQIIELRMHTVIEDAPESIIKMDNTFDLSEIKAAAQVLLDTRLGR